MCSLVVRHESESEKPKLRMNWVSDGRAVATGIEICSRGLVSVCHRLVLNTNNTENEQQTKNRLNDETADLLGTAASHPHYQKHLLCVSNQKFSMINGFRVGASSNIGLIGEITDFGIELRLRQHLNRCP